MPGTGIRLDSVTRLSMKCLICKSNTLQAHMLFDDRYGYPGKFALVRCGECGHVFLNQEFTPGQLTDLYSNYYPRSNFDLDAYQPYQEENGFWAWLDGSKSSAFRWVPESVRVLDVGCGFGESLGYHADRGCDVYGVEADKNIRRVADKFGYHVHVGLFDPDIYEPEFFDYVTMDQVMEHVADPIETLQGVARILKPGGKVILTTPNANGWGARVFGRKWINWHTPYHLQFYSEKSMQILVDKSDLEIVDSRTITPSAWLHFQWLHLLTYPGQGEPSKFWAGSACGKRVNFTITQKVMMRLLGLLHRVKINHLITRVFDSIGLGDNRLVFLRKP